MTQEKKIANFRKNHLGRHLNEITKYFKSLTLRFIQEHGYPELTDGQLNLLIHLNISEATSTSFLVESLGISKQAISRMLWQCEQIDLLKRITSEEDARSQNVILSTRGLDVVKVGVASVKHAEKKISSEIGRERYLKLKSILSEVNSILDLGHIN